MWGPAVDLSSAALPKPLRGHNAGCRPAGLRPSGWRARGVAPQAAGNHVPLPTKKSRIRALFCAGPARHMISGMAAWLPPLQQLTRWHLVWLEVPAFRSGGWSSLGASCKHRAHRHAFGGLRSQACLADLSPTGPAPTASPISPEDLWASADGDLARLRGGVGNGLELWPRAGETRIAHSIDWVLGRSASLNTLVATVLLSVVNQ
jgi:hypothetical protein